MTAHTLRFGKQILSSLELFRRSVDCSRNVGIVRFVECGEITADDAEFSLVEVEGRQVRIDPRTQLDVAGILQEIMQPCRLGLETLGVQVGRPLRLSFGSDAEETSDVAPGAFNVMATSAVLLRNELPAFRNRLRRAVAHFQ